jgi:hypothetical protein
MLQKLILQLCLKANFPSKKVFIDDIFPTLLNKTLRKYV